MLLGPSPSSGPRTCDGQFGCINFFSFIGPFFFYTGIYSTALFFKVDSKYQRCVLVSCSHRYQRPLPPADALLYASRTAEVISLCGIRGADLIGPCRQVISSGGMCSQRDVNGRNTARSPSPFSSSRSQFTRTHTHIRAEVTTFSGHS